MRIHHHLLAHCLSVGSQLLAGVLIARTLSPSGFGDLSLLQSICLLITPLTQLGTKGNFLRDIGREKGLAIIQSANTLSLITSSLAFFLLLPTTPLLPNHLPTIAPLCFAAYCLGEGVEQKASRVFLLHISLKKEILWTHSLLILTCLAKALCAVLLPTELIIPSLFACSTLQSLAHRLKNQKLLEPLTQAPCHLKTLAQLFLESWPLTPPQLLGQISKAAPALLLAAFWGPSPLGVYTLAVKSGIFFQIATQLLHERHLHNQTWQLGLKYGIGATIPYGLTIPLLPLIYGQTYSEACVWALCLIPTHIIQMLCIGQYQTLHTNNLGKKASSQSSLAHLLTLLLHCLLIPLLGPLGATLGYPLGAIPTLVAAMKQSKTVDCSPKPHYK